MVNQLAIHCVQPKQNGVTEKPHIFLATLTPRSRPLIAASPRHIEIIERKF
jgi:hypothetical protein